MVRWTLAVSLLIVLWAGPAAGEAALVIEDGQVLEGESLDRERGLYFLTLESGDVLVVPVELVREVRLARAKPTPPSGLRAAGPETLAGPPSGASLPRYAEQMAVFGEETPSFQRSVVNPYWRPESDWLADNPGNQFRPTRWLPAPYDPSWRPVSAFRAEDDVTNFRPTRWMASPYDPTWWPSDGFSAFRQEPDDR